MILIKEKQCSSYDDFKDEQIGESEQFNVVGGIEKIDCFANISAKNDLSGDFALDTMLSIRYSDEELREFEKNILTGNNFFHTVRFFRTILLYVCNTLNKL
ncbi:MAG: hypothetical protein LBG28_09995 [Tannerella sp.]|jgi:hypothetical protein|nr:hypothetical protein [Tannerella sp.]